MASDRRQERDILLDWRHLVDQQGSDSSIELKDMLECQQNVKLQNL